MEATVLRSAIEAILFVVGQPLSTERLAEIFHPDASCEEIDAAINAVSSDMQSRQSGVELVSSGGGWRLRTRPDLAEFVKRAFVPKPKSLTAAALETLTIIAYRQPIVRPDLEKLRGVDCGGVLKTLADKGLIKIVGRKDEPGQPILYATTPQFLELFGLNDISELPPLRDASELREEIALKSQMEGLDLGSFVAQEASQLVSEVHAEDEEAIAELDNKMKDLRRLERVVFAEDESSENAENEETTETAAASAEGEGGSEDAAGETDSAKV